jgi:hypothetical protein
MTLIGSVELYAGVAGVDFARISLTTPHGAGVVRVIYDGPASGAQVSEVAWRANGQRLSGLKRASVSRPSGEWNDDDYDVVADGGVVGRIMKAAAVPVGMSWMWTLAYGYHEDRSPTHGYEATREAAMAAFAKSWRRE